MKQSRLATFSLGVAVWNLAVILWGAYVRATGSGAGCGNHWPLCNGGVVPRSPQLATIIEYGHRTSSAVAFVLVLILVAWVFRQSSSGAAIRRFVLAAMGCMLAEVAIGAGLVLFGLVQENSSVLRAIVIAIHLANTFLLLGSLTTVSWLAGGGAPASLTGRAAASAGWVLALIGTGILGMSGAVTALGDTIFPAQSLAQGIQQELGQTAHFLLRLRVWHPFVAVSIGLYVVMLARTMGASRSGGITKRLGQLQVGLFFLQLALGLLDVLLLAPVWLQMIHLFVACSIWIGLVLLGLSAFSGAAPQRAFVPGRVVDRPA